jgi:hypothetical protein
MNGPLRCLAVIPRRSLYGDPGDDGVQRAGGQSGVPGRDISRRPVVGSRGDGSHGPGIDMAVGAGCDGTRRGESD